ncbi:hypothetical protein BJX76DRAFT_359970 [Aspergillus varians]
MATPSSTTKAESRLEVKPARVIERKRQKAEKARKFAEKQARLKIPTVNPGVAKEKKEKSYEPLPEYIEETPKGQKKLLKPLDDVFHKIYVPKDGTVKEKGSFVITAPPPNVTGALNCGYAMATALQDTMVRWNRMRGLTTLWVPGCDHAGISTKSVVEKMLWRREKQTRYDLGREKFVIWDWKEEDHKKINTVLRRMGGNLDPKEVIKATTFQKATFPQGIPECGADALRFCLVTYSTGGSDINFDIKERTGDGYTPTTTEEKLPAISLSERWTLHKLTISAKETNQALAKRELSKATQIAYRYWYDNLCYVYIGNSKEFLQIGTEEKQSSARATLYTSLEEGLKMMHPFMPFLTEELWQCLPRLPGDATPSIMKALYPEYNPDHDDPVSEAVYDLVLDCSRGIRSLMAEYSIKDKANAHIQASDGETYEMLTRELASINSLCGKVNLTLTLLAETEQLPANCVILVVAAKAAVLLELEGGIDVNIELQKTQTRAQKNANLVSKLKALRDAPDFTKKSNKTVQEAEKSILADLVME